MFEISSFDTAHKKPTRLCFKKMLIILFLTVAKSSTILCMHTCLVFVDKIHTRVYIFFLASKRCRVHTETLIDRECCTLKMKVTDNKASARPIFDATIGSRYCYEIKM